MKFVFKVSQLRAGTRALQRRKHFLFALILFIFLAACPAYCSTTYFVQPDGSDSNSGTTINSAFKTITKGVNSAAAGDTIYLRGGTHYYSAKISISKVGTSSAKYNLIAYPGERPILDFSAMAYSSSNRGISLSGQYWYMKGFDIYKAGDNGMNISGSNNIIEFCAFYENCDSGLQIGGGAANNQIINCDSYYNYDYLSDPPGGNADGFAPKLDVGTGNYFYGCRSWQNSDDAYDGLLSSDSNVTTTYENCWAFKAGYLKDGTAGQGNGNGFKMGGNYYRHNAILKNCLCFNNLKKGFDQNHNKGDMTIYNCTSFSNGGNNYKIYESPASGKTATVTNCISAGTGGIDINDFVVQTTNSWMNPPFVVTNEDFVSIDANAAYGARKADGNLPDINFMHLATGSDLIDGGTDVNLPYNGAAPDLGAFEYLPGPGDCHPDGVVDWLDLACLADNWLTFDCGTCNGADFDGDNQVDFYDFAKMAENWLK